MAQCQYILVFTLQFFFSSYDLLSNFNHLGTVNLFFLQSPNLFKKIFLYLFKKKTKNQCHNPCGTFVN